MLFYKKIRHIFVCLFDIIRLRREVDQKVPSNAATHLRFLYVWTFNKQMHLETLDYSS